MQQTAYLRPSRMRCMSENETRQEDDEEMISMNIKQFIEATRQYLFALVPAQPALATVPLKKDR